MQLQEWESYLDLLICIKVLIMYLQSIYHLISFLGNALNQEIKCPEG